MEQDIIPARTHTHHRNCLQHINFLFLEQCTFPQKAVFFTVCCMPKLPGVVCQVKHKSTCFAQRLHNRILNLLYRSFNVQSALHKQWHQLGRKTERAPVWYYVPLVTALGCKLIFNADLHVPFCGASGLCRAALSVITTVSCVGCFFLAWRATAEMTE